MCLCTVNSIYIIYTVDLTNAPTYYTDITQIGDNFSMGNIG